MRIKNINNYNNYKKINKCNNHVYNTNFRGCFSIEVYKPDELKKGNTKILTHESYFFRDLNILMFIKDFVSESTNQNINIVSAGCSEGFELLSIKMLLDSLNKNINYMGFDPGKESIKKAKSFRYSIFKPNLDIIKQHSKDSYLAYPLQNTKNFNLKNYLLFHKYFKFKEEKDIEIGFEWKNTASIYELKDKYKDEIDFKEGNILDLSKILPPESTDVLLFKNSLYHLTHDENRNLKPFNEVYSVLTDLVNEVDKALKPQGVFVLGSLATTHVRNVRRFLYQILENKNFKPILVDRNRATVWQKQIIKNIK